MSIEEATAWQHKTVLLHEAVQALVHRPQGTYLDATYGRGGHSRAILAQLGPTGRLIAIDRDPQAMQHATSPATAPADARFAFVHTTMSRLSSVLAEQGVQQLDGVLMDLGISSPQIDDPSRGFSFRHDGPLDMRMDPTRGESAASYLASATEADMTAVLREYGEERFAAAIARAIVARRAAGRPLERTADLAALCAASVRTREPGQDPATRTFQALRIRVNHELDELRDALEGGAALLAPLGRLAVISFHSLEDRIVKTFIAQRARTEYDRRVPMAEVPEPLLRPLARLRPGDDEVRDNPRARSAILRVAERTEAPWRVARPAAPAAQAARGRARGGKRDRQAGGPSAGDGANPAGAGAIPAGAGAHSAEAAA